MTDPGTPVDGVELPIALVLGVARLGEVGLQGWWRSHGLAAAGEYVLGGAFPRTWECVALQLDILSAARRHDELLDRPSVVHLFSARLPFRRLALAWLDERKTAGDRSLIARLRSWDMVSAQRDLRNWTGGAAPAGETVGAGLRLGVLGADELADGATPHSIARLLAASYLDLGPDLRSPYFDVGS